MIREALGPETPVLQTVFSALAQAKHLAGDARLLVHLRRFPEAVEHGLRAITQSTEEFIRRAAEIGADGIFYAVQHARSGLLTREEFLRFSRRVGPGAAGCRERHVVQHAPPARRSCVF